jgi:HK97 family phage major capsid protein/HK97 family phage prohead protease
MNRAYSILTVKAVDEDHRVIEGIASTPTADREGDVVEPMGAAFKLPLPLLWQHRADEPVGHVEFAKPTKDGIPFRARLAQIVDPGELKNSIDKAWQAVKAGLVRGVSIGFVPLEYNFMESGGVHFLKWTWLELSLVTIPANQDATITAIKSLDREHRGAIARNTAPVRLRSPEVSGAPTKPHQQPPGNAGVPIGNGTSIMTTKTVAEQIVALEQTRAAKFTEMTSVMQKSIDAGRSTDAAEQETFDGLEQEVESIDGDLKRLRSLEKAAAVSAKPVGEIRNAVDAAVARAGSTAIVPVRHEEKLEKGIAFVRLVSCMAEAVAQGGGALQSMEIAKGRYGENHDLVGVLKEFSRRGKIGMLSKAPTASATTGDSGWAGSLVPLYQRYAGDFLDYLRPMTVVGKLGQNGIPGPTMVPFNVNIAGQTTGAVAGWVGESQAKPVTRAGFTNVNFGWYKIAAICVLSDELIRLSSPSAEALMRSELAKAVVERMDIDFLDANVAAMPGVRPASVTNGVSATNSTGNDADAVRADVRTAFLPFINANINPAGAVWVMSTSRALALSLMYNSLGQREFPDMTMTGGTFVGVPVISSEYATADSNGDDVVLLNAPDIWMADDGDVTIDVSREASLQMQDNPTIDAANGGAPIAASLVSMFQTNSVAIRAERYVNWAKRRTQAVQIIGNVNWGEPGSS